METHDSEPKRSAQTAAATALAPSRPTSRGARTCSIVIPVHNKASLTRQCLNTLLTQRDEGIEREIVVVDDGSTDLTPRVLAAFGDRIRVVRHDVAGAFASACNAGAAAATGENLVFLNNDTLPQTGWLEALVAYADAQPAAAVVGAKLLLPDDTIQHAGVVFGHDGYPHHLYAGFPADHPAPSTSRRFQAVTGACCLIRREAFDQAGGFDSGFLNGWEDVDLCLRLGERGYEVHYCADSVVYHLGSSSRDLRSPQEAQNRGRYGERWLGRVRPDAFEYYLADGLLTATFTPRYPIRLTVSPLLAGIDVGEQERLGDRLLQERARQVASLLRNNILLNLRVQEAELKAQEAELRARAAESRAAQAPTPPGSNGSGDGALAAPESPSRTLPTPKAATAQTAAQTAVPAPKRHTIIGSCERPGRQTEVVGETLAVSGWALSKAGILGVETFVDGQRAGYVTYGQVQRPDVVAIHPGYPDGENCGFAGRVPTKDLTDGLHELRIRVVALDGSHAELRTQFEVDSTAQVTGRVLAAIDQPRPGSTTAVRDRLMVVGWAVAPAGIARVETLVDDEPLGTVAHGALRPDVALSHPDYPDADHSGFTGSIPLSGLAGGPHTLRVRVTAADGRHTQLTTRFVVDASASIGEVPQINAQYPEWLRRRTPTATDLTGARDAAAALAHQPTIGLTAPVAAEPMDGLARLVDDLRDQVYEAWQLRLVTDPAASQEFRARLDELAESDPRISVVVAAESGPATAFAEGMGASAGDYVGWLRGDESFPPLALLDVARLLNEHPDLDVVYGDEDKLDEERRLRWDPFFKPDWSPDLLLSTNYLGSFVLYRRSLLQQIGGLRPGFDGAEAYDLALRATERTERIGHVSSIVVSHRLASTADGVDRPEEAAAAERRAIEAALERRRIAASVEPGAVPHRWRVRYELSDTPPVTIVMPTGGKMHFLRPCLESLLERSSYRNLRFLLIDNSNDDEVAGLVDAVAAARPDLSIRRVPLALKPFNFSAIINHAIPLVETPYLVLLNDDVTVITPDWVEAMLEHAQRPEVGVVGAKLLYPDDTIQHAGVILGPYQGTGHAFKQFAGDYAGYFGLPNVVRNYSAVTFACAMLRRDVFDEVGLLDAENLPIAFNDLDMCLRVRERGYSVVYTPHAVLHHHESVTKTVIADPREIGHLRTRWSHVIERDPFYNPNLTRRAEDFSLDMTAAESAP
ncbi:MAG: glycosyltransferase family 2 protein [Chloroflexota bacterium]|nr:glycosyltransferase family 2 protein [Chloroflexota bacterium]